MLRVTTIRGKAIMRKFLCVLLCMIAVQTPTFAKEESTSSLQELFPAVVTIVNKEDFVDQLYENVDPESFYEYLRPFYEWYFPTEYSRGSGFIISSDGYIVTNAHVIEDATETMVVLESDEKRVYKASVVGMDLRTDIAVLKIENPEEREFPYVSFGDSDSVLPGDSVIMIGTPKGLLSTLTKGIVSAVERSSQYANQVEGYIQIDSAVNSGNSGGPLFNERNEVIGVVSWTRRDTEGLGFAIPTNTAKNIADQIISNRRATQGFLGIKMDRDEEVVLDVFHFDRNRGAEIVSIIENSPAEKGELQVGDRIVKMDGKTILSPQMLKDRVCVLAPDTKIELVVERDGETIELSIELGDEELSEMYSWLPYYLPSWII